MFDNQVSTYSIRKGTDKSPSGEFEQILPSHYSKGKERLFCIVCINNYKDQSNIIYFGETHHEDNIVVAQLEAITSFFQSSSRKKFLVLGKLIISESLLTTIRTIQFQTTISY